MTTSEKVIKNKLGLLELSVVWIRSDDFTFLEQRHNQTLLDLTLGNVDLLSFSLQYLSHLQYLALRLSPPILSCVCTFYLWYFDRKP